MTYYVKPPDGKVLLRVMEEGVNSRMKFLLNIHSPKPFETEGLHIEHLMENSSLDRISHFMLRLSCLFSPEFKTFFIGTETKFFEERLSSYHWNDVLKMVLILQRHLRETEMPIDSCGSGTDVHSVVGRTCSELLKKKQLLKHAFHKLHNEACRENFIIVDFQHCLFLVRKREVELRSGRCLVHCGAWRKLLICFFHDLLVHGVEQLARSPMLGVVNGDVRLKSIILQTLETFNEQLNLSNGRLRDKKSVKWNMVDMESKFFPPCALNIFKTLRHDHRVGHHARIQFSLFLKGIGMEVNEAIKFWKEEYSKTPHCNEKGSSSCQHAWKKDNSRYVYNIQHLYGLKGSCRNYQSKSCLALQSTGGKTEEGCPFVRMSSKDILKVLPQVILDRFGGHASNESNLVDRIIKLTSEGKPMEACKACFDVHYAALQADSLVSCKESVLENNNSKRSNNFSWMNGPYASPSDVIVKNMCSDNASKVINSNERMLTMPSITSECFDVEVTSSKESINSWSYGDNQSSGKRNSFKTCTNEMLFNNPMQYFSALKLS